MSTITAVITSFNRRSSTLDAISSLLNSKLDPSDSLEVVLVDDGSSDGTVAAVKAASPGVHVVHGCGDLYWSRGTHLAMKTAAAENPDYYLWVNDDVKCDVDAVARLVAIHNVHLRREHNSAIVVGATRQPGACLPSYGAYASRRGRRMYFDRVWDPVRVLPADTMNGNFVLISRRVVDTIGLIDPYFEHAMGDMDYGLRAKKQGITILAAPGFIGTCQPNPTRGTWKDDTLRFTGRWRHLLSRKGLPPRSWWHFTSRHGGLLGPVYFVRPYAGLLVAGLSAAVRTKFARRRR